MMRRAAISAFALLVIALIAVVVVLPDLVAERDPPAEPQPVRIESPSPPPPAPSTGDPAGEARARRAAEVALDAVLARQSALEAERVAVWGGADYERVLADIARGDAALRTSRYDDAARHYVDARADLEALAEDKPARLERLLDDAHAALEAGDGERARLAFGTALALAPDDARAASGLARARVVEQVAGALAAGAAREAAGDAEGARAAYAEALELDTESQAAREALARVSAALAERDFRDAMSAALGAMERSDLSAARRSLAAARAIDPGSARVRDLAAQIETAEQARRIDALRKRADALAAQERWREAEAQYASALDIDAHAAFARDGLARARERARIHAELDAFLAAPERLRDSEPRARATHLLGVARAAGGDRQPRLADKAAKLGEVIARVQTPVRVEMRSDNLTDVVVYRVARLGAFERRVLSVPPGDYVAVGSRAGYRDVRVEFTVEPGEAGKTVLVRCEEQI